MGLGQYLLRTYIYLRLGRLQNVYCGYDVVMPRKLNNRYTYFGLGIIQCVLFINLLYRGYEL